MSSGYADRVCLQDSQSVPVGEHSSSSFFFCSARAARTDKKAKESVKNG